MNLLFQDERKLYVTSHWLEITWNIWKCFRLSRFLQNIAGKYSQTLIFLPRICLNTTKINFWKNWYLQWIKNGIFRKTYNFFWAFYEYSQLQSYNMPQTEFAKQIINKNDSKSDFHALIQFYYAHEERLWREKLLAALISMAPFCRRRCDLKGVWQI